MGHGLRGCTSTSDQAPRQHLVFGEEHDRCPESAWVSHEAVPLPKRWRGSACTKVLLSVGTYRDRGDVSPRRNYPCTTPMSHGMRFIVQGTMGA